MDSVFTGAILMDTSSSEQMEEQAAIRRHDSIRFVHNHQESSVNSLDSGENARNPASSSQNCGFLVDPLHFGSKSASNPRQQIAFLNSVANPQNSGEHPMRAGVFAGICESEMAQSASFCKIASDFERNLHKGQNPTEISSDRPQVAEDAEIPSRWFIVNVGGMKFEVSAQTLSMDHESMLATLVQRHTTDDCSELRIDRDGHRFLHVLNYLRNGTIWLDEVPRLREVQEEAGFYLLSGLQKLCEDRIQEIEARKNEESKKRTEEIEEIIRGVLFDHKALCTPKTQDEVVAVLRGRRLGISEPAPPLPRFEFDLNADF